MPEPLANALPEWLGPIAGLDPLQVLADVEQRVAGFVGGVMGAYALLERLHPRAAHHRASTARRSYLHHQANFVFETRCGPTLVLEKRQQFCCVVPNSM
jgi:hypothetical protein